MHESSILDELLSRWEKLRAEGKEADADQLCGAHPELRELLKERIAGLQVVENALERIQAVETVTNPGTAPGSTGSSSAQPCEISGYEIQEELGRGGMGAVFRARDLDLGRALAVKVLLQPSPTPESLRRFREEAQITGQLQHPGIPPVHELGTLADGRPFFAMKLIKGQTLAELLRQRPDVSADLPRFLAIFEQICQALAYAHSHQVIHRDLKPGNVMVGVFGEVQLMDWGLAKVLREEPLDEQPAGVTVGTVVQTAEPTSDDSATQAGWVMGTLAYMAPEQARGEVARIGKASDVFGLGAMLCEILTGMAPYIGSIVEIKA